MCYYYYYCAEHFALIYVLVHTITKCTAAHNRYSVLSYVRGKMEDERKKMKIATAAEQQKPQRQQQQEPSEN